MVFGEFPAGGRRRATDDTVSVLRCRGALRLCYRFGNSTAFGAIKVECPTLHQKGTLMRKHL